MTLSSHEVTYSGLHIANEVIGVATTIVIKHVESNVLSGLEDIVYAETFAEVWVDVILDSLGSSERSVEVLAKVSLVGNFDVGIRLAKDVEILEVSAAEKQFYSFEEIACCLHRICSAK